MNLHAPTLPRRWRQRKRFPASHACSFAVTAAIFVLHCLSAHVSNADPGEFLAGAADGFATYQRDAKNRAGIRKSDLLMRILHNGSGPIRKEQAWQDWRATRLEWTYANDPRFVAQVQGGGATFAGAMASGTNYAENALVTFDGIRVKAHGRYRGCMNNSGFVQEQHDRVVAWESLGADSIQHDEALTNFTSFHYGWATCFCEDCVRGFSRYCEKVGAAKPFGIHDWSEFHYREYLRTHHLIRSDREYERLRERLPLAREFERYQAHVAREYKRGIFELWESCRGEPLVFSMNMVAELAGTFGLSYCPILDKLDYLIGEYYIDRKPIHEWLHSSRLADAFNLEFIASIKRIGRQPDVDETRVAMAVAYASGRHVLLPWDIYIHDGPRWYADIDDYRDIVDFIADHPQLFDGYRAYQNVTLLLPLERIEYEQSLLALVDQLQKNGILYNYAVSGFDRNQFVFVPIHADDFSASAPVWRIGDEADFAASVWPVMDRLIHRGEVRYHGQLCSRLFALSGKVITQVQALHDTDDDGATAGKPGRVSDEAIEELRRQHARNAVDRILQSGVGPVYKVADPESVVVLPRVHEARRNSVMVHVVNASGKRRSGESVWLHDPLFGEKGPSRAVIHRPGAEALEVALRRDSDGWALVILEIDEWAIIAVEL